MAFTAWGSDLVTSDTNGHSDVFVHDRASGATERVSVSSTGVEGDNESFTSAISADGRYVLFRSYATNLVAGDTNLRDDLFVRDRIAGTTERVTVDSAGAQSNGWSGEHGAAISADGRYVCFSSSASNLVANDTNSAEDVFVRDRLTNTTERVSVSTTGAQGNQESLSATISADGRFVAFRSSASNLVPGDTNNADDDFVRDRQAGTTERVSISSAGVRGNQACSYPVISANGRYVAFGSAASNLVPGDTNWCEDVFVHDRLTGATERVSVGPGGVQANSSSASASISADGRYVIFSNSASNLVPGDTNGSSDVFVHDRSSGSNERISVDSGGSQTTLGSWATRMSISCDGNCVAFSSSGSSLVAGDTNHYEDVFVRDRALMPRVVYCTAGTTTHGCLASIAGVGTPSGSSGSGFNIYVSAVEGQVLGLIFYGVDNSNFAPAAWGASSSFLCVRGPRQRMPVQISGGTFGACDGVLSRDWNAYIGANPSSLGAPFIAGEHVYAQGWFRDLPSPKTTNLSNALEFVLAP